MELGLGCWPDWCGLLAHLQLVLLIIHCWRCLVVLQLLDELGQRLVQSNILVFLDLVTEPRLQLLFPEVILLLEPLNGYVLLQDLLLEHLDRFLVSLSSCFLAVGEVLVLIPELLHLFV